MTEITTNAMLLEFMKGFKSEINAGNAALSNKIEQKIETIDRKLDKNIEKINVKIGNIDDAIDRLRIDSEENKVVVSNMSEIMNKRMDDLEKEMYRSDGIRKRTERTTELRKEPGRPAGRQYWTIREFEL